MKTLRIGVLVATCTLAACGGGGGSSNSTTTTVAGGTTSSTTDSSGASITVTPNTGLTDGQTVHVVAKGFKANAAATVTECLASATTLSDCDTGRSKTATADSAGTVTLDFVVHKAFFDGKVTCTGADACRIGVSTSVGTHARATITFS